MGLSRAGHSEVDLEIGQMVAPVCTGTSRCVVYRVGGGVQVDAYSARSKSRTISINLNRCRRSSMNSVGRPAISWRPSWWPAATTCGALPRSVSAGARDDRRIVTSCAGASFNSSRLGRQHQAAPCLETLPKVTTRRSHGKMDRRRPPEISRGTGWPNCAGIGGRFRLEWVADSSRNAQRVEIAKRRHV